MTWDHFNMWLYGIFTTMFAGIIYLVRIVFTNSTELKLLKQQMELQNVYLAAKEVKLDTQLMELRSDIKALIKIKE